MKLFVTGATGFVGGALVRRLVAEGAEVCALCRPGANREGMAGLPVRWFEGDITWPETLVPAIAGAEAVIHAAGLLGQALTSEESYWRVNVDGTRHVLAAAAALDPQPRVLHISSAGVLGPLPGRDPSLLADESWPLRPSNAYERSKAAAEQVAAAYAAGGLPVVMARPEFLYGPGDRHVLGLFRAIQRRLFFYIGDGRNTCHPTYIEDGVTGMLACLRRGQPGRAYLITGPEPVTFRELAGTIAAALELPAPRLHLPAWLAWAWAGWFEGLGRAFRLPVPLSRTGVAFFSEERRFSSQQARQELGYRAAVTLAEGVRLAVAWYREQGLL